MRNLEHYKNFIGCDVSKNTLDFAIYSPATPYRKFQHIQVENSKSGFKEMRKWLRSNKIKCREAVIAMEYTGIYSEAISHWCKDSGQAFVFLHPQDVKNACSRGRNKTDKVDSQFIADYLYTMREKLEPSDVEPDSINKLRQLYNERKLAVKTRTAYLNQIKTASLPAVVKRMEKMIAQITEQITLIEKEILRQIKEDKALTTNYDLLISIPGIGMLNAVLTIVATGNFTRFQTARQYAKFCCVSPLSKQSGSSIYGGDHVSHAGHTEIKSILTEGARSAIRHDPQLRTYYERKREQGKTHGCVMNAVKFKLICRMFAVIRRQSVYVDIEAFRS